MLQHVIPVVNIRIFLHRHSSPLPHTTASIPWECHIVCATKWSWKRIQLDLFPQEPVLKCQTCKISTGLTYFQKPTDWSTVCGVCYCSAARKHKAWSFILQPETLEPLGDHHLNQESKQFPSTTANWREALVQCWQRYRWRMTSKCLKGSQINLVTILGGENINVRYVFVVICEGLTGEKGSS